MLRTLLFAATLLCPALSRPAGLWNDAPAGWTETGHVAFVDRDNFAAMLRKNKLALVLFYAPWCGHCQKAKPHFARASAQVNLRFAALDCTAAQNKDMCKKLRISSYPTFVQFWDGTTKQTTDFEGQRSEEGFVAWAKEVESGSTTFQSIMDLSDKCADDEWDCGYSREMGGHECISADLRCDGSRDCGEGDWDEQNCARFKHRGGGRKLPLATSPVRLVVERTEGQGNNASGSVQWTAYTHRKKETLGTGTLHWDADDMADKTLSFSKERSVDFAYVVLHDSQGVGLPANMGSPSASARIKFVVKDDAAEGSSSAGTEEKKDDSDATLQMRDGGKLKVTVHGEEEGSRSTFVG